MQFYLHQAKRHKYFHIPRRHITSHAAITKPYNYKRAVGIKLFMRSNTVEGIVVRFPNRGIATQEQIAKNIDVHVSHCDMNLIRTYKDMPRRTVERMQSELRKLCRLLTNGQVIW